MVKQKKYEYQHGPREVYTSYQCIKQCDFLIVGSWYYLLINDECIKVIRLKRRVKSGNGQQVNSDIYLQTVEIRLIRIFTVCLVILFFYSKN